MCNVCITLTQISTERERAVSWSQNENISDNHGFIMCQMQSWLWFKYNHELATTLLHLKYTYIITDSSYVLSGRETVIWSQNKNNSDKYRSREYIRKKQISMISIVLSNYISISKSNVEKKLKMYYLKYFPSAAPYSWLSVKIRRSRISESLVKLKFSFCVNSTSNFLRHKSQSSCNVLFCGVFTRLMFSAVGCFPLQMAAISIQIGTSQHTNL